MSGTSLLLAIPQTVTPSGDVIPCRESISPPYLMNQYLCPERSAMGWKRVSPKAYFNQRTKGQSGLIYLNGP
jgi:hypothetical protein